LVTLADLNINYFSRSPRAKASHIPVSNRVSDFREVNPGLPREAAITEAERCFHCGNCNLCENCYVFCPDIAISLDEETGSLIIDRTICKSCGICIKECPRSAVFWEDGS
ncbi:MAG: 4Fe-4S binding protein, partial [Chloroflexi bacterium]|nr:4Fe-4S binding protein [Chloroflexota bacterium]